MSVSLAQQSRDLDQGSKFKFCPFSDNYVNYELGQVANLSELQFLDALRKNTKFWIPPIINAITIFTKKKALQTVQHPMNIA